MAIIPGTSTQTGTGSDTLTLRITQDAYQGDSQYAVYVDGKQVGGTFTAKALHNSGQYDTLQIKGDWSAGNHNVSVKLLNDLYGGSPSADRNIYVEGATYNGAAVSGSNLYVNAPGAKSFTVTDTGTVAGPTAPPPSTSTPTSPAGSAKLTKTGPVKSSYAGQVIENLDVWADSGHGITVTHDNVIIRNVRIHHKTGDGINVSNAKGVQITKAEIRNMDPPTGTNGESDTSINNIDLLNAHDTKISYVSLHDGATGIYANYSPRTIVDHADGYNFHGGFPRGQFVQFGNSDGSKLTNFYTRSDLTKSRTEDNVNIYHSNNVIIENGVIDGNNSRSGVGVLFEGDSGGGIVRNVDVVRMSNGGFSSYSNNVDFFDVRVFDGHMNTASGRGSPLSNGVSFAVTASGVGYDDATYTRPANPSNIFWGSQPAEFKDIRADAGAVVMDNSNFTNEWSWIV
jgi:Ca-dependent carbohydrate-binding module xylan-binding/Right handed beta helix region